MIRWYCSAVFLAALLRSVVSCGYPGSPAHAEVTFSTLDAIDVGTIATYQCEPGFELLGPSRRRCTSNGTWTPAGSPFCVMNVAAGKAPMQSSVALDADADRAVDGSTSTFFTPDSCTMTEVERSPWWYVNLLQPYMVQLVRLDFGKSCCGDDQPATIVVRVGNSRPDLGVNAVCNRYTGFIEEGRPLFLPCNPPMPGAFVSVHLESPEGNRLSICETFVYTDQATPIENCPQFRDQEPGSSATYNGKCYLFHDNQQLTFNEARQFCEARGGSLIDETNPALQGFISWELWRRHSRSDPNGQYWMGLMRDESDPGNWRWLSGKDVSVSFWNQPSSSGNCARYNGNKGWLWSETTCNRKLFFICQHRPKTCGRPEQPTNGTLVGDNFSIGKKVEYRCDPGHMVNGPSVRTCQPSGFFNGDPPVCKYVECGWPARIPGGSYEFVNGSREYLSIVAYSCKDGYQLIGRGDLICDIDGRWNGPPPRCEPVYCLEPPAIANGGFRLSTNSTVAGTVVDYYCWTSNYVLAGTPRIVCQSDGHYDQDPPVCIESDQLDKNTVERVDVENTFDDNYYYDDDSYDVPLEATSTISFRTTKPPSTTKPTQKPTPPPSTAPPTTSTTSTTSTTTKKPRNLTVSRVIPRRPHNDDEVPFIDRVDTSLSPQDNEISDIANHKNSGSPDVNVPRNKVESGGDSAKLNLGGIIALGVFGGFVFLSAIITTFFIAVRRFRNDRRYRRRREATSAAPTTATLDSCSEAPGALNKSYRQAWDNLHQSDQKKPAPAGPSSRPESVADPNYRTRASNGTEGHRDEGEIVVDDYYAKQAKPDKKRHHHHHHHKHSKRGADW